MIRLHRLPALALCFAAISCLNCSIAWAAAVLLVVTDSAAPNATEQGARTAMESSGHTVAYISDHATQAAFDTATASADVAYVMLTTVATDVNTKLRATSIGVVYEDVGLDDDFGLASASATTGSYTAINVTNNTHPITTGLATGSVTLFTSAQPVALLNSTLAPGLQTLATQGSSNPTLAVVERNATLANTLVGNSTASGRRVRLPWGGDAFNHAAINSTGLALANAAITWAAQKPLLLHYKLDSSSGATATDSSTYARTGTVTGTATWVSAVRNNGFDFNGATNIQTSSLLSNPINLTVAAWVNVDAVDSSGSDIVSLGDHAILRITSTAVQGVIHNGTAYVTISATHAAVGNGWRHYVITFDDAANQLRIYIDGALVTTGSVTSSISYAGLGTATVLGRHGNAGTVTDLNGRADDVRVYNYALNQVEVAELYGLVGHWKLNEASGTAAADSSGAANNGTHTNGPLVAQTGAYDSGAQYDGANDYTTAGSSTTLKVTESATIAVWVKPSASANAARIIVNKEGEYQIGLTSAGVVQWAFANTAPGWTWHPTTATIPNGTWSHIAVTYTSGTVRTYVDGVLKETFSGSGNVGDSDTTNNELRIAGRTSSPANQYFGGVVDEVRVYNRALSLAEIADLQGSIGYWTFDEGAGTTIGDSTGKDNDAAFFTGTPTWIDGVRGKALYFDGTTDARTNANIDPPAEGTVAFWMRSGGPPTSRQRPWGLGADFEVWQDPDGLLSCDVSTDGFQGGFITTTPLYTASRWYHVAAVYDSDDDSYRIYIDGQLHKSGTSTWAMVKQAAARLSFGTRTGTTERFIGALDDFRMYNRKLTAQEIAQIYGLVGHWKFDEGAGTAAADSSGIGGNATLAGATWSSDCSGNTAVAFDGVNDTVSTNANFTPPATGSVAFWMQASGTPTAIQRLFALNGDWEARIAPSGTISFDLGASPYVGNEPFASPVVTDSGRWYHVVAMFNDATDAYQVYVNGELTASGTSPVNLIAQPAGILTFGTRIGTGEYWQGSMRDFRVYDRWMLTQEIQQSAGFVAHWQLNEPSGTVANDLTIAANNATYVGTPTLGVAGTYALTNGTAVDLNGTSQYITAGKSLLNNLTEFSLCTWVRPDSLAPRKSFLGQNGLIELGIDTQSDRIDLWTNSGGSLSVTKQLPLGKWTHVVAVGDGAGLKLYINGIEAGAGGSATANYGSNSAVFKIGEGVLSATGDYFDGRVDDVRVFSRVMCAEEVYRTYRGGRPSGVRITQWLETR